MPWQVYLAWFLRFIHITSAIAAIGAPFFVRFALLPSATAALDEPTHQKLRETVNRRWSKFVYIFITLFLITGLYNFLVPTELNGVLVTARWKNFPDESKKLYHMLFGVKFLAAFVIFFLASALAGRSAVFAPIRRNARMSLTLLLLMAALVVVCSTLMRYLPFPAPQVAPAELPPM